MAKLELTEDEKASLANLDAKYKIIGGFVEGVCDHYYTGLFLSGEGGTGKSYKVLETLAAKKASVIMHNSRITGRGLVDTLQRAPTAVHLIEDAETMMDDKRAFGVLRSALWSQSKKKPPEREITWTAWNVNISFIFTGGIIIISNADLAIKNPEVRAMKTRVAPQRLDVPADEILALMKKICIDGYSYGEDRLSPDECWQVATFIKDRLSDLKHPIDLRLLKNGFHDYLHWRNGNDNDWHTLLESRIKEAPQTPSRATRTTSEAQLAAEIRAMKLNREKRIALWEEKTGHKGEKSYYRALKRADKGE